MAPSGQFDRYSAFVQVQGYSMRWQRIVLLAQNLQRYMRHSTCCLGTVTLILSASVNASEFEELLDELRWQARILLVFTADEEDARATAFFAAIGNKACAVSERDILVGHINPAGESYIADKALSESVAPLVRDMFGIAPTDFRILLIGKDGGVKATYSRVPELSEVFGLIDGMPMRRREAQARPTSCPE